MKKFKKVGIWVIVSLFVQSAVLFYLDKYYFITEKDVIVTKLQPSTKPVKKDIEIKIPEKVSHLNISFDGKYLAYSEGDSLKVVNTLTGGIKEVTFDKDVKVSYYKWFPDINSMIIAEKKTSTKGDTVRFSNYDAAKDKKKDISNDNNGNAIYITLPDKKSEIEDIELSTLTNMIYVKVKHSGNRNSIYTMDVMAQMQKLKINSYFTGNILTFPHEARMAYEDLTYKKVYVTGANNPVTIKGVSNPCVLGTDDDDKLYVGQIEGDKVKKIYYGVVKDSTDKWQSLELKTPVNKKDIYVAENGTVYANNNLKGVVTILSTGKEISYKGQFLQMYNGGIISNVDGILSKTSFGDKE